MSSIINYFVVRRVYISYMIMQQAKDTEKLKLFFTGKAQDLVLNKTYHKKHHAAAEFCKCADLQLILLSR